MRFRRLVALLVVMACSAYLQPGLRAVASAAAASELRISGTVLCDGSSVAGVRLLLRNVDKGTVVGHTLSNQSGAFSFVVPEPGLYVVEALNESENVTAVSAALNSTTAPLSTNVILQSKTGFAGFFSSSAFLMLTAAAGIGTGIWIIASGGGGNVSSPER